MVTRGLAYCRERVAADKLPKNTLGKILKAELAPHGGCGGSKVMMRKLS